MSIRANNIHRSILAFWHALQANPDFIQLVKADKYKFLQQLISELSPLMANAIQEDDKEAWELLEATFEKTHDLVGRLHHGVRYQYLPGNPIYGKIGSLTVGRDPSEDHVRLCTLIRELPAATPPFHWAEDLSLASCTEIAAQQVEAVEAEKKLGKSSRHARQRLMELRPASQELWTGFCVKWILANVDSPDQHQTWGLEKKKAPKANGDKDAKSDKGDKDAKSDKAKGAKSDKAKDAKSDKSDKEAKQDAPSAQDKPSTPPPPACVPVEPAAAVQ